MAGEIIVESGLSWLRDKLIQIAEDRCEALREGIADGVPLHEYSAMVGRYKEAKRLLNITLPDLFAEFDKADEDSFEQDDLAEMKDDS